MNNLFPRRALSLLLALVLSFSLVLPAAAEEDGEGGEDTPTPTPAEISLADLTLSLSHTVTLVLENSTYDISAEIGNLPAGSAGKLTYDYIWSSSNPAVASVESGGGVSISPTATATLRRGGTPGMATVTLKVTVTQTDLPANSKSLTATCEVLLPGITLDKTTLSMKVRGTAQLAATPHVPAGSDATVTWSSSNDYAATVSSTGLVTALSASSGDVFITAKVGAYEASCRVSIEDVVADTITGSATADDPLSFSYIANQIDTQCRNVLGTSLSYVTSLTVPTSAGTLYYGYTSEGEPGSGVGTNENYYYASSRGNRLLSDITFVPKPDFSGTATINYTGYDTAQNNFQGKITISVSATSGITYSTTGRSRVDFNPADFSAVCSAKTGHTLQYISFSLPSASRGTLFYKYSGSDLDNKVESGKAYYLSKSPRLEDVTFVAADGYSGTVTISYQGRDTNGNSFSGTVSIQVSTSVGGKGNINYTTTRNRAVRFRVSDFNNLCEDQLGYRLDYVRFVLPSSSQGTLYYNYSSSNSYGSMVSASTNYYRNSSPYLDNISFVPAGGYTGTVNISFTGWGSNNQRFTGTVAIEVEGASSSGSLTYTIKKNGVARFDVGDFDDYCERETDYRLNYVRFTLPPSSRGTLYYNYSSSSSRGTAVSASTSYYRSSSPYLDNISFVPASGYTGTVDIDFTGYNTNGQRFTGTVRITVRDSGSSGNITYSTQQDTAVDFVSADFDDYCEDETDQRLNYVRFTLPSSSRGTLYYNYSSPSSKGSAISSSTSYYRSSSPYLNNISFVPASGYTGDVNIDFTGYSTSGERFTGTVTVTVKAAAEPGIIYHTVKAGTPLNFSLATFQNACSARNAGTFTSASFTSLPASSTGQLRYNYVSADEPGSAVTTGTTYNATGSPLVSNVTFVPSAAYSGVVTLTYTGRDNKNSSYTGTMIITVTADTSSSFTDMGNYGWANSAVEYLYANNIVTGTGNGRFSPGASITRGSFMLMLDRAFDFNSGLGAGFADVPEGSVYTEAIKAAQALGIAQGSGSNFYPTRPLSRQQAAVFLARAMRADGWTLTEGTRDDLSGFSDAGAVSDYAVASMTAMIRLNIFQGGSDGKLNPQAPLTRAQMAVILTRAITL